VSGAAGLPQRSFPGLGGCLVLVALALLLGGPAPAAGGKGAPAGPETAPQRPNRLAGESSPYLLLHADDPVDWYPWGAEAIARAREEGRPIFLSIGYTACYWCHVMAREVFADPEIAALMNRWFVNVKVDREERPDVDEVYIAATQLLTGGAGWPNSVFLTPELEPFFAGTYFPPAERGGRPGFPSVLRRVHADWTERPAEVRAAASRVAAALGQVVAGQRQQAAAVPAAETALAAALAALEPSYDPEWGGFARAPAFRPKFPSPGSLFLLLAARERGDEEAGRRLDATLRALGRGAIHDQLAGGFHRYTVDREWRVPHFEKMLADNALLLELLAESLAGTRDGAAPVAHDPELARLARRTADFLLAEMALPGGGFRSSLDAESEGEEGRYYTWTGDELRAALGAEGFALLAPVFGFDDAGELPGGRHTLHWTAAPEAHARRLEIGLPELTARLETQLVKLRTARERRSRPRSDDKLLADWNGLAIAALARAGEVLAEPRYRVAAERAAERVLGELRAGEALLHARRGRDGGGVPAFLDDYAHLAHGLLALHRASGEARWLTAAAALADEMAARLGDPAGGWFHAAPDPHLLFQPKSVTEGSVPAGNAVAVLDLLELAARLGASEPARAAAFRARAEAALRAFARDLELHPAAVPTLARALLRYAPPPAPAAGSSGA
jgi:uncharacterized protein YyaL (SSP411 family)